MSDPIQSIATLLDRIGDQADVEESAQWYLRSNLIDYKRALLRRASSQEIEFATGALMRFCAQALDASTQLYRDCIEVANQGAKIAQQLKASGREESLKRASSSSSLHESPYSAPQPRE